MPIRVKIGFTKFVAACLLAAGLSDPAIAQNATQPFHIFAVLWRGETEVEEGFRAYLTEHNIPFKMTVRNLDRDRANAPPIVAEIKRTRPDLVYTWGTGTTSSIFGALDTESPQKFVRDLPGLFVLVAYPLAAKLVESYARPGRSLSGTAFLSPLDAQLNTIRSYHSFKKIAVIYDRTASNSRINVADLRAAVKTTDIALIELPVPLNAAGKSDASAIVGLVRQAKEQGAELLYMGPDSFISRHSKDYTAAAIANKMPTFSATEAPLRNSQTMFGLVSDYYTVGKLAGLQAERILVHKQAPQDLPVAHLSRYKLWINMDVAHQIGMYPPMNMISVSDFQTSVGDN